MKPVKKVFVYKSILSLALLYSDDMFINELKLNLIVFLQNGFQYRKNLQLLLRKFPCKRAKQMFSKVLFVGKKMQQTFGHLQAKIVIIGNSKSVKNHHFLCSVISLHFCCHRKHIDQCPHKVCVHATDTCACNIFGHHFHFDAFLTIHTNMICINVALIHFQECFKLKCFQWKCSAYLLLVRMEGLNASKCICFQTKTH